MGNHKSFDLYVFGDQTYDIQTEDLRTLVHDGKGDPIVVEFLERARRALRNDLYQLGLEGRRHAPSFACTTDFLVWKKGRSVPVDMAILCLYQLGSFMKYESRLSISEMTSFDSRNDDEWAADTMGLYGPGLSQKSALAAAAVSCCSNTLELLPLAVEAVRLAFRIGMLVDKMARCIEPWNYDAKNDGKTQYNKKLDGTFETFGQQSRGPDGRLPWTFLVTGSDVDACLRKYNEENNLCENANKNDFSSKLPCTSRPWISSRSTGNTVAVSGRPSSLARFFSWRQSLETKQRISRPLQIFAPYHAPHLYSCDDTEHLLHPLHISSGQSSPSTGDASRLRIPLISSTTGSIVRATSHHCDFKAVLRLAVEQILLQPIRWEPVLTELKSTLQTLGETTALRVFPVATTVDQLIYNGLQQQHPSASLSGMAIENNHPGCTSSARSTSPPSGEKIAIIGMAGRFPEAATTDALWDILRLGFDVCKEVPPLRWDAKTHVDQTGRRRNSSRTSLGCWLNDPDVFDAQFFGLSAQEATRMDPAQRLSLMTTYEAIEQAGIVWPDGSGGASSIPSTRPDRVGVYCGVAGNDWRDCNAAQKVDSHFMRASNRAFISGRISEVFKLGGPSVTVDTSSSGSLAPVHLACRSLCAQETDMCVVSGAHVMTNPDIHAAFDRADLLSHSGNCKVFAETSGGFCRGEGVVSLVLKRLEDALAGNDTILGVIAGVATNYNLQSRAGDSESGHGTIKKSLFTELLNRSSVDPTSIGYVEMGGPGTELEDVSQMASAVDVLGPRSTSGIAAKRRARPLYLGSATANIGHSGATSGLSSIVKVLLMLREDLIPPHIGPHIPVNSKFPVDLAQEYNTHINTGKAIKWENDAEAKSRCEPRERRRAIVHDQATIARASSALLLEEEPLQSQECREFPAVGDRQLGKDPPACYIITISAKSKTSLLRNMANLHAWLLSDSTQNRSTMAQISYTTTARRNHYAYRTMLVVSSVEDLLTQIRVELQQLRLLLKSPATDVGSISTSGQANISRPIVFAFTACNPPSSSLVSYFQELYEIFSQVRGDMYHLDQIVKRLDLPSVVEALGLKGTQRQAQAQLSVNGTTTRQMAEKLAHMCIQMVLSRLWRSWGINPVALVIEGGMDIYSALSFAGVLSDADAVYLAGAHFQLGLQQQMKKGPPRGGDLCAVAATELQSLDRVTTYHKAQIPVLRLIRDERSPKPRLDVLTAEGEDNQMLLARQFLANIKTMDFDSQSVSASDFIAACRASDVIPDQSVVQFMGPEAPKLLGASLDNISDNSSFGDGLRTCNTTERGIASQDQPKIQTWSHLTETLRELYYAGASIRWDQYHIDRPPSSRRVISTLPEYSWDLKEYWVPYMNDWTLHKGDSSKPTVAPKLESTTIHTIIEETELFEDGANKLRLIVEADISRDDLHGIVQGHVVDGVPLCTPSVYSDIALSLGRYMQQRYHQGCEERLINIKDMAVTKALIAQPSGPQLLQAHVEADWDSNQATCKFSTVDRRGKPQQHAQCTIVFSDTGIMEYVEQFDMAASYNKLVKALRQGISTHRTVRFTRNMMYRMISSLAEFHPDHKLVEDIVLDSQTHEATAVVSFGQLLAEDKKHVGSFHTHPGVVDALTQPAGFALNGADTTDLDKEVYINHGWGSFYLFEPLELTKAYTVYVHMIEGDDHIWYGDIVVLDMSNNDSTARVVALFEKYSVQRMPRRVLSILLRAEGGGAYKNAKAQSGHGRQGRVDHRQDGLAKPAQKEIPSPSSTLVSPVQEFEKPLRPAHTSSVPVSSLHGRVQQNLHIKVGMPTPTSGPPTPLTAKALLLNNQLMSSLRVGHDSGSEVVKRSLQIISEESGYELADIDDDKLALADLGVDSLLSLAIISRFREELGDTLSHLDLNTLFMTCPTVGSLKAALAENRPTQDPRNVREWRTITTGTASIPLSPPDSVCTQNFSLVSATVINDPQVPQATSVILQGSPKKARATLFLFPDGSGSATSYASIPPISSAGDICVIAFNCPFLKKEASMSSCSLDALMNQGYLPELHRRLEQLTAARGGMKHTYYVGGWSAGGTLAYRAAQRLLQQEDDIMHSPKSPGSLAGLVLIDAPPPIRGMDPLPDHFYKYCEQKGVFGGWSGPQARKAPDWLIPHFNGTIAILQHYVAEPLTRLQSARLKVVACLWAGESVIGSDGPLEPHPDDTEGMKFLTVQRTDFSTAGWEKLVPGVDEAVILCQRMEGAHHFSLTRSPYVSKLAAFVRQAMSFG